MASSHFFYYAGWADKLEYAARGGRMPHSRGVVGSIVPWNFSALDGGLEDRAGARCRQHDRAQAGRDHARCPRCGWPRFAPKPISRRASSTSSPATASRARRWPITPASIRSRSPVRLKSAKRSSAIAPVRAFPITLELGGKAANIVFARRAARRGDRRHRERHLLQSGVTCVAPVRGCSCKSRSTTKSSRRLAERIEVLRIGDPLDKNTDIGAINSRAQLERIQELVASGVAEGATLHSTHR